MGSLRASDANPHPDCAEKTPLLQRPSQQYEWALHTPLKQHHTTNKATKTPTNMILLSTTRTHYKPPQTLDLNTSASMETDAKFFVLFIRFESLL